MTLFLVVFILLVSPCMFHIIRICVLDISPLFKNNSIGINKMRAYN